MKWRDDKISSTLRSYRDLVFASDARLIILPETALPLYLHEVPPDYLDSLAARARSVDGFFTACASSRTRVAKRLFISFSASR